MEINYQISLHKNSESTLGNQLTWIEAAIKQASRNHDAQFKVLVGGDSSVVDFPRSTVEEWQTRFQNAFELTVKTHPGFTKNSTIHNHLAQNSTADYLVISGHEVLPEPKSLDILLSTITHQRSLALVDAKQIPYELARDEGFPPNATSWCSREMMMVSKAEFEELDGFDEVTFIQDGEDVDLSWRIRQKGKLVHHQPAAVVYNEAAIRYRNFNPDYISTPGFSPTARLMLAWKWSRMEIFETIWREIKR
jgi:hypothetical protein